MDTKQLLQLWLKKLNVKTIDLVPLAKAMRVRRYFRLKNRQNLILQWMHRPIKNLAPYIKIDKALEKQI